MCCVLSYIPKSLHFTTDTVLHTSAMWPEISLLQDRTQDPRYWKSPSCFRSFLFNDVNIVQTERHMYSVFVSLMCVKLSYDLHMSRYLLINLVQMYH